MDNLVLDIRGQIYPVRLLMSFKELNNNRDRIKNGEVNLVVLTDHTNATRTIPKAATARGYSVNIEKKEGYYEITIKKEK